MYLNVRNSALLIVAAFVVAGLLGNAQCLAQNAYITNFASNTVSVIDTATNTVIATAPVGSDPAGVAVTPDGSKVYVANENSNNVSVIDTATNTVIATIPVGIDPLGVAVTPDGSKVYVASIGTVSVIDTVTNTVTAPIGVDSRPRRCGQPRWKQGLCRGLRQQHRGGDRYGDQCGHRYDRRRRGALRRRSDPGWQ